ncbi:CDP-glucose 4,6-dehydratase [Endothiovibrio diazotrophicus]
MFSNIYRGKRVVVTGHTGFKGGWLTSWLLKMGAEVIGVSKDIPTQPSMFEALELEGRIRHHVVDIRELEPLRRVLQETQPDFVFHMAAQPLVSEAYRDPLTTVGTNVLGTVNVLEALRALEMPCVALIITSDKCYENVEWPWGYRETDVLGGKDVYSGSKAAAEVLFRAYRHSFFQGERAEGVRLASVRAGNVIGGGDWAADRIVPDCVRAWSEGRPVVIRSPHTTRPWQHVLEPLSGYLALAQALAADPQLHGESFNFGPLSEQNKTVLELLTGLAGQWGFGADEPFYEYAGNTSFHEAQLLKLNCDKALFHLKWRPTLGYDEVVEMVAEWYLAFYRGGDVFDLTQRQLARYEEAATERGLPWTA